MNIERLKTLRDFLLNEDSVDHFEFNMMIGYQETEDCGTIGCIAGATCYLFDHEDLQDEADEESCWPEVRYRARTLLGLSMPEADDLFQPLELSLECSSYDAAQAVQNLIAGKKPWGGIYHA